MSAALCLVLVMTMCLSSAGAVFAGSDDEMPMLEGRSLQAKSTVLNSGGTVSVTNYNAEAQLYETPRVNYSSSTFTYNAYMPKSGLLMIEHAAVGSGVSCYVKAEGSGAGIARYVQLSASDLDAYYVPSAGNVKLTVSVSAYSTYGGYAVFGAYYAPSAETLSASTNLYFIGSSGSGAVSTMTVSVPATGYLTVSAADGFNPGYSVYVSTAGFKGWKYLNDTTFIGVKKGTYKISLKGAPLYSVKLSFTKIKETSAKTSKKKAAKIKKGKLNKGIIVTNSKKVHWYKIKNPKNQKLNIAFDARKMTDGGSGTIKITAYFPKGKAQSITARAGDSGKFYIRYGTVGTKKALKGTYYIKVESKGGTSGYYTLKWK